ncbi:alcohol dehydrogenase catalytic domain-containing protein [Actinoplanes sp. LDG1-06]|uniref:Alcohol dehydrogenase catalytic domain-containing protein n=1 Tax=Paractinoplanes ovalisporus TaxID=2810368 RepID=A0ABS2AUT8_9ACTN|nr:alcohol dehydrogenase catalytic domain-containing protein [Actinoplanes ovalisporus]MBM2623642.1 alcohol dehydrogenase catalytic domain-containing protein [Actinoplanes ovalisporus]
MTSTQQLSLQPVADGWPDGSMTATALVGPHRLEQIRLPIPRPVPGEVLVRPHYVGLCGTDLELFEGTSGYLRTGRAGYPHVFGHEWWGEVVATAGDVSHLAPGDQVVGQTMIPCGGCGTCARGRRQQCRRMREVGLYGQPGAAAGYIRLPGHALHRIPPRIAQPWTTLVEPAVTVAEALARASAGPADRVAVLGTGTIGLLAVQLARRATATVTAVGVEPAGLAAAERYGALSVSTGAAVPGFSLVIEASGAPAAFRQALELTEPGGRVAVVGVAYEAVAVTPADVALRGLSVLGIQHGINHYPDVIQLFADGVLDGAGLLAAAVPVDRCAEAFARLAGDRGARPKVVLDLTAPGGPE